MEEEDAMGVQSWCDGLSPEQAAASSYSDSHARLLAGPGTGKTHTLARRVVFLVSEQGVPPSVILVLTFTRVATYQLRSIIGEQLAPYTNEMPHISTIHAFSLRQLRRNAKLVDTLPQPLRIADDWEEANIIREDLKALLDRSLAQVDKAFKQLSADWETLAADTDNWRESQPDQAFLGAWDEHRRIYGYTLRAELVYQLKRAMTQIPGFALEPRFKHLLIDEYQDLNPCDLAIAAAIAKKGAFLLACGDDDQSIYGFRFADPDGIRRFLNEYPGAANLALNECRRCGSRVLAAALAVAKQDHRRIDKPLHAVPDNPPGEVRLLSFQRGTNEAAGVALMCRKLIDQGTPPSGILILVRSDRNGVMTRPLRDALSRLDVPVANGAEKRTILDEKPGRRLLAMMRLIANPRDHLAWRTRIQLTNGLGTSTIRAIYDFARREGITLSEALRRLPEFLEAVPAACRGTLTKLVDHTTSTTNRFAELIQEQLADQDEASADNLIEMIQDIAAEDIIEEEGRAAIVAYLENLIKTSHATTLEDLLLAIAIGRDETEPELDPNCVNLLTMHQAKGLSADVVFIMAAEDETLPRHETAAAVEDDRRLLYVSMTRARKALFISYCGQRTGSQKFTGRNDGGPRRHLTRFLRSGSLQAQSGEDFVKAMT